MVKISVITPVYKVENYLRKCVESILAQTFTDFELFIVDDGSPDACGGIADEYELKDARVHVIHKENGGAPSARNAGIAVATGEYMYFPDSDDWLEPTYLQELYDIAISTEAQLVISGYTMEYCEGKTSKSYAVSAEEKNYSSKEMVRSQIHQYFDNMMMAVPWNKLYKSDYIRQKKLLFPNVKWDDLHFNMEVMMDIEKVAICSSTGYHFFRSRTGSETTSVFDTMLYKKRKEQFEHILRVYRHWNIHDKEIMQVLYGYYAARLVQCVQEIASSKSAEKHTLISEILKDELSRSALKHGRIESRMLAIASIPLRVNSISACILMGKGIGFVKKHMSSVFYQLKSTSVNKAKVERHPTESDIQEKAGTIDS